MFCCPTRQRIINHPFKKYLKKADKVRQQNTPGKSVFFPIDVLMNAAKCKYKLVDTNEESTSSRSMFFELLKMRT